MVISVGKNNYGHPSDEVLEMLDEASIKTYRTDENGTIIGTSTGKKVTIDAIATEFKADKSDSDSKTKVYITKTGKNISLVHVLI